jgi:hypothetical protein
MTIRNYLLEINDFEEWRIHTAFFLRAGVLWLLVRGKQGNQA